MAFTKKSGGDNTEKRCWEGGRLTGWQRFKGKLEADENKLLTEKYKHLQ